MRRYPSSMRFARGKRNERREAFIGAQSRRTPISASPYIRRRAKSAPSGAASATLSALKPIPPRLFLHQGGDGVEQTDGSRETRMGLPLSFICGRPHGKRFLRVERFGRLRSYVRPFGAAHTSAGLDEVRRTGSLSLERALCSCSASGCSRHSVTTVSFITFRCACQTRSSGPLACSDGGLFLMPLRTSRRESIRQFSSSPRRSGPAYWPRPP
jgi:hypothetical protein